MAGNRIDPEAAQRFLARVITDSRHGQDPVPTRAKALVFRQLVTSGKLRFVGDVGSDVREALPRWPDQVTEQERLRIESFIRASWGSLNALWDDEDHPGADPPGIEWAKEFWRANWRLFVCVLPEPIVHGDDAKVHEVSEAYTRDVAAIYRLFLRVARTVDPDLYNPDRYEVLTGIVGRILRYLAVVVRNPSLWTMEHGAPLVRSLAEARILIRWLLRREDEMLYRRFKDFGRGRLKLLKLHLEDYVQQLSEPPEGLTEYIEYLDVLVNQDLWEEWQEIDLSGNFANVDVRKMAIEVGLEPDYRFLFAPASSNVHGEWSVIDEYVFDRCQNPLHRGHRVLRDDLTKVIGPQFVEAMIDTASAIVEEYTKTMAPQMYKAIFKESERDDS